MPQMMPSFWMVLFSLCSLSIFVVMSIFLSFSFLSKGAGKSLDLSMNSWIKK
nr:ATP synthase F0 subunit 8 [Osculotes curta]